MEIFSELLKVEENCNWFFSNFFEDTTTELKKRLADSLQLYITVLSIPYALSHLSYSISAFISYSLTKLAIFFPIFISSNENVLTKADDDGFFALLKDTQNLL